MTNPIFTFIDDNYVADLQVAVNGIADMLREEAADTDDPEARAAWVRAEVGREALRLGVEVHDRVLLAEIVHEALKVETGMWWMVE